MMAAMTSAQTVPLAPMSSDYSRSTTERWLQKPVEKSVILDRCDSLGTWSPLVEDQGNPTVTVTRQRSHGDSASIRLVSKTTGPTPIPHGRYYGTSSAVRVVKGENWSKWNRLSFWVFPDLKGFRNVSLITIFHNNGKQKLPEPYGKAGKNYLILKNHTWNHVVWEMGNVSRDKVTGVEFAYRLQGNEPGATDTVQYDISHIELQKVEADTYKGWAVAPGRLAFSHPGYQVGSSKSALGSNLTVKRFQLLDAATGKIVLDKQIQHLKSTIGTFDSLEFSEVVRPGTYRLKAGNILTPTFRIANDVWKSSLEKAINFFYAERCGYAIPGVHDVCHADWVMTHKGKSIVVNGGWHDAGDLSQNLSNTAEVDYEMFSLAEQMLARGDDPALLSKLLGEAEWGLQFVLKTSFHDGYRTEFNTMDRWTDGIIGTDDDMLAEPRQSALTDLLSASAEASAARVLRRTDPILAQRGLDQALEDWKFGTDLVDHPAPPEPWEKTPGGKLWKTSQCEMMSQAVLASLELWKTTHDPKFAAKAQDYGRRVVACQRRKFLEGSNIPLTGYFTTDSTKTDVLRYFHLSREQAPSVALNELCLAFPNSPTFMDWYSSVALYSSFYEGQMAKSTRPYGMLANSIYRDDEYRQVPPGDPTMPQESYKHQVTNGEKIGDHLYVRRFPVWFEFRGNHGTSLAEALGLAQTARLRGDFSSFCNLQQELEWVIGRNPFGESTMWGEGYDYAPQYTAMSGDIVGSLPVGIQSQGDEDSPYWPTENCHNWKEVWVNPTGRWIWLMKYLSGPAQISGVAASAKPVRLVNNHLPISVTVKPNRTTHAFTTTLPEGEYRVVSGASTQEQTFLSGASYSLDLRPQKSISLSVKGKTLPDGTVKLTLDLKGSGTHLVTLRFSNLGADHQVKTLTVRLSGSAVKLISGAKMIAKNEPWFVVAEADGQSATRKEASGYVWRGRGY